MSISAETISLIIGISSFIAAVIFFFAARKSETHTIELLAKIENQTNTLERINDNFLGYAIHQLAKSHEKIIDSLIPTKPLESSRLTDPKNGLEDVITSNIMVYYYTARTNYFANYIRAHIPLTEENKTVHVAADEAISASYADFTALSDWYSQTNQNDLKNHSLYSFASDTKLLWEPLILNKKT